MEGLLHHSEVWLSLIGITGATWSLAVSVYALSMDSRRKLSPLDSAVAALALLLTDLALRTQKDQQALDRADSKRL